MRRVARPTFRQGAQKNFRRSYPYPGTLITANEGNETSDRNETRGTKKEKVISFYMSPWQRSNVGGPMVHTRGGPYGPKATRDA